MNRDEFWATASLGGTRITTPTKRHLNTWFDVLAADGPSAIHADATKALVRNREQETKGRRARLWHRDAREKWGGASAAEALRFRWNPARTIINDIISGGADGAGA